MRQDDHDRRDDHEPTTTSPDSVRSVRIGDMSPRDFARLGLNHIAYIRAVHLDDDGNETDDTGGQRGWSIHAANGERIGLAPGRESAVAATLQHDMQPLSVH